MHETPFHGRFCEAEYKTVLTLYFIFRQGNTIAITIAITIGIIVGVAVMVVPSSLPSLP